MKRLFAAAAAAFLAVSVYAGPLTTQLTGATGLANSITAAQTSNYTATVFTTAGPDLKGALNLAIQASFKCDAASVSNVTFTIQQSVDNSHWLTYGTMDIASSGTATVGGITNISTGAVPYWRIYSIANPHATANVTNLWVTGYVKPGR